MPRIIARLEDAVVNGPRGPVFGPLTATSSTPVTVITGSRGSGRTALLLVLAGRMRLDAGRVEMVGITGTAAIRRRTGIAGFTDIDALEPTASVAATLRERLAWVVPWYRRAPRITSELAHELLEPAFGPLSHPTPAVLVRDLVPADEMLLRVALALTEAPMILVVDDFDELRSAADRQLVAERLNAIAAAGTAVIVATTDPADAAHFEPAHPTLIAL